MPNFSARANYDDYAICTSTGEPDGRLGIKLGVLPQVQIIDAFRKDPESAIQEESAIAQLDELPSRSEMLPVAQIVRKTKRPELHADDVARMTELMAKHGVVGHTAEVFHALLEWVEAGQQQQVQTVQEVAQTLNWFTKEVEALRAKVRQLECDLELAQNQVPNETVEQLQQENDSLRHQLQLTQSRLEGIQNLLGMDKVEATTQPVKLEPATPPKNTETEMGNGRKQARDRKEEGEKRRDPTEVGEKRRDPEGGEKRRDPEGGEKRRDRNATTEKIHQAVDAVISWNTAQEDGERQLRISIPTIKGLASAMGANYQPAIQEVLKEREAELEGLHRRLMLGSRHNAGVKGKEEILQAIAREYLGLENWNDVKY